MEFLWDMDLHFNIGLATQTSCTLLIVEVRLYFDMVYGLDEPLNADVGWKAEDALTHEYFCGEDRIFESSSEIWSAQTAADIPDPNRSRFKKRSAKQQP